MLDLYLRNILYLAIQLDQQTKNTKNMTNLSLVQALKKETETMKIEYLNNISVWAVQEFEKAIKINEDYLKQKKYYINSGLNELFGGVKEEPTKEFYQSRDFLLNKGFSMIKIGLKKYVENEVKKAQEHYENSILKLSSKIQSKGLNLDKLEVKSGRVDVNFETTLTDGEKVVRAFTIIAEGEIQKPHYRYLIK